jgi:uncharacterized protein (TIGR02117 family)
MRRMGQRLLLIALCMMLITCTGCLGPIKEIYPARPGEPSFELSVVSNGWHTSLAIERSLLSPKLQEKLDRNRDAEFVEVGWGEDGFYRSPKATTGLAIQALLFSRASVLHIWTLEGSPQSHYANYQVNLESIRISQAGLDRLNQFLERALYTTPEDNSLWLQDGWNLGSHFYKANGRYSLFHTCNHWTADAIRSTGFPITPAYSMTAGNVMWQVELGRK